MCLRQYCTIKKASFIRHDADRPGHHDKGSTEKVSIKMKRSNILSLSFLGTG